MLKINIVPYEARYQKVFSQLNIAWLEQYFKVEPIDEIIFANPESYIIEKGGAIFFAKLEEEIVGSFALLNSDQGVLELAKMAVRSDKQGQHIGSEMLQYAIEVARKRNAHHLILFSNTKLQPAIHLYRKFGFKEIPLGNNGYLRSNIKMELTL